MTSPRELTYLDAASAPAGSQCDPGAHCITCSDEGIPMVVAALDGFSADCRDEAGERHSVAVDLLAPVRIGDRLLVHAGVAIAALGAEPLEAER